MNVKNPKRPKFKIKTGGKLYSLAKSPLYELSSKKKLSELLFTDLPQLQVYAEDSGNYNAFYNSDDRLIERPNVGLDKLHSRIASLICRIEIPDYLHSGRSNHSHISNALTHVGNHKLLTSDICKFFPSTTRLQIFKFFNRILKCSSDISDLLSHICSYKEHLPTGSRISMPLAFWANKNMFEELNCLSLRHDIIMTVFVDDITFSGNNVNPLFISSIKKIVKRYGHNIHPEKTKLYSKDSPKLVTGIVLNKCDSLVRNKQHRLLNQDFKEWNKHKDTPEIAETVTKKLLGRLISFSAIEPKYKDKAKMIRAYSKVEI
jgi:hypothetical protein